METVSAEVYNNGLNPIGNFPISYTINGGTAVVDTFVNTIAPGVMEVFTFLLLQTWQRADLIFPK
mgnify:CR=1 FL=1